MRAVWSLWTKPLIENRGWQWEQLKTYLFSWILSVDLAKRHYPDTMLVTDDLGRRILVDGIGLQFENISTDLDSLAGHDPSWWNTGKLYAYRLLKVPFLHLDSDVFLWSALPRKLEQADVIAQNPEFFAVSPSSYYRPELFEQLIADSNGWLPREWEWFRALYGDTQKAICCGIFGGNHVDFINYYADTAVQMLERPENAPILQTMAHKEQHVVLLEQFLLAACIDYYQGAYSRFGSINPDYLFHCFDDAYHRARVVGFTHLIGDAKNNPIITRRLDERVKAINPELHARALHFLRHNNGKLPTN
jgi:hypothetical protein